MFFTLSHPTVGLWFDSTNGRICVHIRCDVTIHLTCVYSPRPVLHSKSLVLPQPRLTESPVDLLGEKTIESKCLGKCIRYGNLPLQSVPIYLMSPKSKIFSKNCSIQQTYRN